MALQIRGPMAPQQVQYMQPQAPRPQRSPLMGAATKFGTKAAGSLVEKAAPKLAETALGGMASSAAAAAPGLTGALGAALPALGPIGAIGGLAGKAFGLFNTGGPVGKGPLNPHGYNEGGSVMETPLKKVMDEQKLEQNAMAFELDQKRKQEAHDLAMKQKQQQFAEAQKMKKAAATTAKTAAKPKGPLSK